MGIFKNHIIKFFGVVVGLIMTFHVSMAQHVDDRTFEVEKNRWSTVELIEYLQGKSGYVISYSSRLCFKDNIRLSTSRNTLMGFLEEIFQECPFDYIVRNNRIILSPRDWSDYQFTIIGYVSDSLTGERLIGANVFNETRKLGTATNNYGFYSLTMPGGEIELNASFIGYKRDSRSFVLSSDTIVNFVLGSSIDLPEIAVVGSRMPNILNGGSFGAARVSMDQMVDAPALFGEPDLMRGIQMLPGIQSGSEGFSGLYVRGGGPDQNLVLLDDVPVYNVGHLLGFFSIFNTDAVKQVSVTKDGFPARYGGRLSSVVDVRMKDGRQDGIGGRVSLGLLSSAISLDGPIVKDKSTFAVSFRRSYIDALAALYQLGQDEKTNYYFFDFNGKINYTFSDRSKLYFSIYRGRDKFYTLYNFREYGVNVGGDLEETVSINDESNAGWGNFTGALRWNYVINSRLFVNFTGTYSNYRFFIGLKKNDEEEHTLSTYDQRYLSGIQDYSLKSDFEYYISPSQSVRFGVSGVLHKFNPGVDVMKTSTESSQPEETVLEDLQISGDEFRAYIEDEFSLNERFFGNIGLHTALFRGESMPYLFLEPRASLRYRLSDRVTFKGAFSKMTQFVHLVGTAGFSLPTDLWLPVSDKIEPMQSDQISIGSEINIGKNNGYVLSAEIYAKNYKNLLAYKESTGFFDYSASWEDKLTSGRGGSAGGELLFQKNKGNLTGWLGYTYAQTTSYFEELNDGKSFPGRFDRRHDLSLFFNYRFNDRVTGSMNWLFGSGNPITLPEEKYYAPRLPFSDAPEYGYSESAGSINNYRMPSFHRLDLGVNFTKKRGRGERTWSFGVINAYGRQNPFLLYFSESSGSVEGSSRRQLKQLSLFPFPIPYVKYAFKF